MPCCLTAAETGEYRNRQRQSGGKNCDEARDDTPQALDAVWEEEQVNSLLTKAAVIQQSLLISVACRCRRAAISEYHHRRTALMQS